MNVVRRARDSVRPRIEEAIRTVVSPHDFRLEEQKRPATEVVDRTPLQLQISTVDPGLAIGSGGIWPVEPRKTQYRGNLITQIP